MSSRSPHGSYPPPPPPHDYRTPAPSPDVHSSGVVMADTRTVFGQVMFLVAVAIGFAAAGAYIARGISPGLALGCWAVAFALIMGMSFARRAQNGQLGMALLYGIALLLGMAIGPTIGYYTSIQGGSATIAQAGALTALYMGFFGTIGFVTNKDLSRIARISSFALLGLIIVAVATLFIAIPGFQILFSIIGLVVMAGITMFHFQSLRRAGEQDAVMIALGIFVSVFNVFVFILNLLGLSRD